MNVNSYYLQQYQPKQQKNQVMLQLQLQLVEDILDSWKVFGQKLATNIWDAFLHNILVPLYSMMDSNKSLKKCFKLIQEIINNL